MKLNFLLILSLLLLTNIVTAQVELEKGLVAYYPFSGDTQDKSIYNNHATSADLPTLGEDCEDQPNEAFYFNGINNYLEIENIPQVNVANSIEFSISLWIKPEIIQKNTGGQVNDILSKWTALTEESYPYAIRLYNHTNLNPGLVWAGRYETDNLADTECSQFTSVLSTTEVLDNNWHHIVFQRKEYRLELYVDGDIEGVTEYITECNIQNNSNIVIGKRTLNSTIGMVRPYQGGIDELRIYNRSLNQEEIETLSHKKVTNVSDIHYNKNINIYPNPLANDRVFHITNLEPQQIAEIQLFSIDGVFLERLNQYQLPKHLTAGIYFLKIHLKNDEAEIIKKILISE